MDSINYTQFDRFCENVNKCFNNKNIIDSDIVFEKLKIFNTNVLDHGVIYEKDLFDFEEVTKTGRTIKNNLRNIIGSYFNPKLNIELCIKTLDLRKLKDLQLFNEIFKNSSVILRCGEIIVDNGDISILYKLCLPHFYNKLKDQYFVHINNNPTPIFGELKFSNYDKTFDSSEKILDFSYIIETFQRIYDIDE